MTTHQKHPSDRSSETAQKRRAARPAPAGPTAVKEQSGTGTLQRAAADPGTASVEDVTTLQGTYGNRAVNGLLSGASHPPIQARLVVGPVGDHYEREADRVSEQVVNMTVPASGQGPAAGGQPPVQRQGPEEEELQAKPLAASITSLVQRQEDEEEVQARPLLQRQEEEEEVQMKPLLQRQEEDEELQAMPLAQRQEEEVQMKPLVQRQEEEEELQAKPLLQRQEEEEELQAKPLVQRQEEEEEVQMKPLLQRQEEEEEVQPKPLLQRQAGGGFVAGEAVEQRLAATEGGGSPLPGEVRAFMEPRFGADFSGVRIHTGSESARLNRALSAQAFTRGQDIYMGEGRYDPGTDGGKRLLAHELTHVVQQTGHAQPAIQRWNIRSRLKRLPKGHELITQESLAQAGLTDEKLQELGLQGGSKDIIEGSTWNDLPGLQLLHRVHYGDLQFLHSMASDPLEKAGETLDKILMWAEFCYKVATGVVAPQTELGQVQVAGFPALWEGRFRSWSVAYLFTPTGAADAAKGKALGSMLHMLQDSFCASHVERVGAKRRGEDVARIKSFHAYPAQDSKRHGRADYLAAGASLQERIKATAGAEDAVMVGKMVLVYLGQGASWTVVKSYLQTVLGLVEPQRGQGGPGEAGPGRQFRKSVHEKFMKDSKSFGRGRSRDLKAIDAASAAYDKMLLYESKVLSPEEALARKQEELMAIEAILEAIANWRKNATKGELERRGAAVDELEKAMRADYVTIEGEIADINRALSH
jgi:hypothetical protein